MRPLRSLVLATALLAAAAAGDAFADRVDAFVALGKTATVTVGADGDVATAAFLLQDGPGKKLLVTVKPAKKSPLQLAVRLLGPDGAVYDEATLAALGGKVKATPKLVTYSLPNVPEGQAGLWRVEVEGAGGTAGGATVTVKAKDVLAVSETLTVPANGSVGKDIDVGSNQALTLTLSRGAAASRIVPRVTIVDPSGTPIAAGAFLGTTNTTKGTVALKAYRLPVFGRYRLLLSGVDGGGGAVKIVAKTAPAKPVRGAPVANPGSPTGAEPSTPMTLDASASTGSGNLGFAWSQVAGTAVQLTNPTTSTPSFTMPASGSPLGFELAVLQNGLWSAPVPVTVEIGRRPLADAGRTQTVAASSTVTLDGSGSVLRHVDAERELRFTWRQDPADAVQVTLTGANTATPTFTAPAAAGVLRFWLSVDDGALTSLTQPDAAGSDSVLVRVGDPATTPDAGREQVVPRMATVHLSGLATTTATGVLDAPLQWTQVSGPAVTLADPTTPWPSFQAPKQSADLLFRLTAGGLTDDVWVHVRPAETNLPPLTVGNGSLIAAPGDVTLSATGSIGPEAGSTLTHRWAQVTGAALAPASSTATSTTVTLPAGNEYRAYAVQANDGLAYGPADLVRVRNQGYTGLPVALAGSDITVSGSNQVSLDGRQSVRTVGGGPITNFRWRQVSGRDWIDVDEALPSFDATAGLTTFSLPSDLSSITQRRTITFELVVNDGTQDSAPDYVTVTFLNLPQNGKPQVTAGASTTTPIGGQLVTLQAVVTDNEGDPTTVRWSQTQGTAVTLSSTTSLNPTFTAPASGTYRFQVIANDGFEDGPASSVTIAVNAAPTAVLVITQAGGPGTTVTANGTGSSDPEGQPLTYTWSQVSGPTVSQMPTNTTTSSWTFPEPAASVTLRLVVNDGRQNSAATTTTFTVGSPVTVAPTANRTSSAYGSSVTLTANATGTVTSYTWVQLTTGQFATDPQVGSISGAAGPVATFTVPKPSSSSTRFAGTQANLPGATFQVTASNATNSDVKTIRITFFASLNDAAGVGLATSDKVYGIVQQSCMGGSCHSSTTNVSSCTGQGYGMGSKSAFLSNNRSVNAACGSTVRVNPGNAATSASYLIARLKGTATPMMPQGSSLSSAQIAMFEDWIDQGAQDN